MARQAGDQLIVGTVDDLTFYKMGDNYYVRAKSSLTAKRFRRDQAFEGARRSAGLLGRASKIASAFYRDYPREEKCRAVFNEMTGRVKLWLKGGMSEEEAVMLLKQCYAPVTEKRKVVRVRLVNCFFAFPRYEFTNGMKARAIERQELLELLCEANE